MRPQPHEKYEKLIYGGVAAYLIFFWFILGNTYS